jgi:hypothetical protein
MRFLSRTRTGLMVAVVLGASIVPLAGSALVAGHALADDSNNSTPPACTVLETDGPLSDGLTCDAQTNTQPTDGLIEPNDLAPNLGN